MTGEEVQLPPGGSCDGMIALPASLAAEEAKKTFNGLSERADVGPRAKKRGTHRPAIRSRPQRQAHRARRRWWLCRNSSRPRPGKRGDVFREIQAVFAEECSPAAKSGRWAPWASSTSRASSRRERRAWVWPRQWCGRTGKTAELPGGRVPGRARDRRAAHRPRTANCSCPRSVRPTRRMSARRMCPRRSRSKASPTSPPS